MGESYLCAHCGACPVPGSHVCGLTPVRIGEPLQFDSRGSIGVAPDPRDARIAELEAALRGLVAALPRCNECSEAATWGPDWGDEPKRCAKHRRDGDGEACWWSVEVEAAERALAPQDKGRG